MAGGLTVGREWGGWGGGGGRRGGSRLEGEEGVDQTAATQWAGAPESASRERATGEPAPLPAGSSNAPFFRCGGPPRGATRAPGSSLGRGGAATAQKIQTPRHGRQYGRREGVARRLTACAEADRGRRCGRWTRSGCHHWVDDGGDAAPPLVRASRPLCRLCPVFRLDPVSQRSVHAARHLEESSRPSPPSCAGRLSTLDRPRAWTNGSASLRYAWPVARARPSVPVPVVQRRRPIRCRWL